jgi:glycosyltransferase involved in cell wall biosynthesis
MRPESRELVSVVICNYNYGRYVAEAIQSVLDQCYTNLQLIVVDDGSSDNSKQVLETFQDSRIQFVYQRNRGQAAAFNSGYERCRGEYVAFLDSDDFWYPRKLEVALEGFEVGNICIVQHNLDVVGVDSTPTGAIHPGLPSGQLSLEESYLAKNHTGFFCPTSGLLCKKSALDQIFPIEDTWALCADVAFTRPLPLFGDIYTLSHTYGAYRIHGENMWMNSVDQTNWVENHQRYVDYANSWLERFDIGQRLDFKQSEQFRVYSRLQANEHNTLWILKKAIKRAAKGIFGTVSNYRNTKT